MLATFDDRQGSIFGLGELGYPKFCIFNGIDLVRCSVRPSNRTFDIVEATIKTISVAKVDRTHSQSLAAIITRVVFFQGLVPKGPLIVRDVRAKARS